MRAWGIGLGLGLRSAVQVINPSFAFVTMFSARDHKLGQPAYPDDLIIRGRDRVYAAQMGKRSVSVFKLALTGG
jgi:hypothetical protein